MFLSRFEPIEHRHSHSDAVFDLVVDEGAFVIHDGVAKFDAAVHGTGVHDVEAAVADVREAGFGDAVEFVVFSHAGEKLDVLALHLDAQQIDKVRGPGHGVLVSGEAADIFQTRPRDQGTGTEEGDFDPELLQDGAGGAGDAGMQDIANNEDFPASGSGKFFPDGEGV